MTQKLKNKVALITGTGGGQGRAAALRFAAEGALVVGCDVNEGGNRETVELVKAAGGSIVAMEPVDLGDPVQAQKWVEEAAAVHGRIDILYNNASLASFAPMESFPIAHWQAGIRNELDLVFYVTRFAWAYLQKHKGQKQGGVIINTASVAGIAGSGPGGSCHAAAKGAVIALTKQWAMEGAPHNIRAVAISPGVIESPGTAPLLADPAFRDSMLAGNMIKRIGQPEEIANLAVFLASDEATYITGSNVVIDGGRVAW